MRRRCWSKNNPSYRYYGGRGIAICKRWASFLSFVEDMGYPPTREHSIDRINNDGDYQPNNCRWATHLEQARNSRSANQVTYRGVTKCVSAWAEDERCVVTKRLLWERLIYGWDFERAITTPSRRLTKKNRVESQPVINTINYKTFMFDGDTKCIAEWARDERCRVPEPTLRQRLITGWPIYEALKTPARFRGVVYE